MEMEEVVMTDLFSYCYVLRYYCLIYVSILSTNDSCIFFKTVCVSAQSSVPSLSLCPHADLEHRSQYRPILIHKSSQFLSCVL